jgi:hypothetical protein
VILTNGAVGHESWCTYTGTIVSLYLPLTGQIIFRCPQCWGDPCNEQSVAA